MKKWMKRLGQYHKEMTDLYPGDRLMIVFDIDDTILDTRHLVLYVLKSFDDKHGTEFFRGLTVASASMKEGEIEKFMEDLTVPRMGRERVAEWFERHLWSPKTIRSGHRPFRGALEVIHWLQRRPNTVVALNTGRPDSLRGDTLVSLNGLAGGRRVAFDDDLLYMNPYGWNGQVARSKAEGVDHFRRCGYRVIAFVDNEPENLRAVSEFDPEEEILLLHADTTFTSSLDDLPAGTVRGNIYDIGELMRGGVCSDLGRAA